MKDLLFLGSVIRADEEERAALRPIGRNTQKYGEMLDGYAAIVGMADDAGMWGVGGTEHHFQTEGGETMPNALLLWSKLATQTKQIKFLPLSIVLPMRDPIRVAEDIALFDNMFPDRLGGVSMARGYQTRWVYTLAQRNQSVGGPWSPEADAANRARFDEYLEVVQKAWTEDSFSYDGEYYKVPFPPEGIPRWPLKDWTRRFGSPDEVDEEGTIRKIGVVPKPLKVPRLFHPVAVSQDTLIGAAQKDHPVVTHASQKDEFRELCKLYQAEAKKAGHDLELGQNIVAERQMFIGDTFEEAFDLAVETAAYWHHNFLGKFGFSEGFRTADDKDKPFPLTLDDQRALAQRSYDFGRLICGTPEQVTEQILDLKGIHGAGGHLEFFCWEFWGQGHPGDEKSEIPKRLFELYKDKVKPHLS